MDGSLTHEQKVGAFLLLIFAIICISLGALQIRNRLYAPFALSNVVPGTVKDQVNSAEALRFRDTDHDGLSDFDELYTYHTSPYLADTDSDGISDFDEVTHGFDPLCAKGANCSGPIESGATQAPVSDMSSIITEPVAPVVADPAADLAAKLADPKQVREMLIGAGLKKELIDKLSDAELKTLILQTLDKSSPVIAKATSSKNL